MAYGSIEGVARLARTWTRNGVFIDPDAYGNGGTNPTATDVAAWIDEVSAMFDIAFGNEGFVTPIVHEQVLKAVGARVNALVADLAHLAHNKGRLFSDRVTQSGRSGEEVVEGDVMKWVSSKITGLESSGVPKIPSTTGASRVIFEVM